MDIKLKTPRHLHQPINTVTVDSAAYLPHAKMLQYTASAPGAGPRGGVTRQIKLSDEMVAALDKLITDDAANIGE